MTEADETALAIAEAAVDELFDLDVPASEVDTDYTWRWRSFYSFTVGVFTIQKFFERVSEDVFEVCVKQRSEFQFEPAKRCPIVTEGIVVYSVDGCLVAFEPIVGNWTVTIRSKHDVKLLVTRLKAEIKHCNPLRRKHLQIVPDDDESFRAILKAVPKTSFNDLILDARLIEDIHDNTIFQLKCTRMNNGVIFHGDPGTGKSLACQAVIHETIAAGFSSCFVVGSVNFSELNEFLVEFLTPCLLICEDIDSFAGERMFGEGRGLSDFLQFLSGVTERSEQIVVIATTNYLDLLDKAVQSRPVRFNRKYKFNRPANVEIDRLLDLYFGAGTLPPVLKRLCHDKSFAGAHIAELKRTATTLARKRDASEAEVFADAVEMVTQHFTPALKCVGFHA